MTHAELTQLVAALRQRQWPTLNDDQVSVLLSWLAHSRRNSGVRQLEDVVGPAGCDDEVFDAALSMLDVLLFDAESLHARQAGLSPELSRDARRRRYRLLMSAFHPDRYPGRAEWLTSRSQIITRSYARFKAQPNEVQGDFGLTVAAAQPVPSRNFRKPPPYKGISPEGPKSEPLRERLARDRFLAHKVIGGLSLLVILPVVSILLDGPDRPLGDDYSLADSGAATDNSIRSLVVDWPLPELEAVDWTPADRTSVLPVNVDRLAQTNLEWPASSQTESPAWLGSASLAVPEAPPDSAALLAITRTSLQANSLGQNLIAAPIRLVQDTAARMAEVMSYLPESDNARVIEALPQMPERRPDVASTEPAAPAATRQSEEAPADPVVVAAANAPSEIEPESAADADEALQVIEPLESLLALGPLANHPAGRLLDSYHRSIEQGDLAGLLDMLAPTASLGGTVESSEFENRYRELFASSRRRALTLRVLHARRQDSGWLVRTDYQLEIVRSDSGDVERVRREVEYSMTEDNGRLRIAAVRY